MLDQKDISQRILKQLLYSEVFGHPLNSNELARYISCQQNELEDVLCQLQKEQLIIKNADFFYLFESDNKINKRISGQNKANQLRAKAFKVGAFIQRFPFVEGVAISGSLSKGILHDDGDFDFFIITQKNRLWIARTLLVLYKKIFLLNSRKYFCVNYFIDDSSLEITEQNRFTATEIVTLIPIAGDIFPSFYTCNSWTKHYFNTPHQEVAIQKQQKNWFSKWIMWLFKGSLGEKTDIWCMRKTLKRWQKKFSDFDDEKFDLTLKSRRYVSKHHPNDFQTKVLTKYDELTRKYVEQHAVTLKNAEIEL
jgi:hypothetical protein